MDTTDIPEGTLRRTVPNQVSETVYEKQGGTCAQETGATECASNIFVNHYPGGPNSTAEAMEAPEYKQWQEGIDNEYDNLIKGPAAEVPDVEGKLTCVIN